MTRIKRPNSKLSTKSPLNGTPVAMDEEEDVVFEEDPASPGSLRVVIVGVVNVAPDSIEERESIVGGCDLTPPNELGDC